MSKSIIPKTAPLFPKAHNNESLPAYPPGGYFIQILPLSPDPPQRHFLFPHKILTA